ncbi:MAG: hypothetical protein GY797_30670 [Deltaproteobacteria bacterium]|nr:hypothetical protein [Deltaproteobacteria bacterium]
MPGISGFVNSNAQLENFNEIIETFKNVHALKGVNFVEKMYQSDHCIITNSLTDFLKRNLDQPASDPTENIFLFLEGEIFNSKELLGYLNEDQDLSPCKILLALFMQRGPEFVSLINGEFNIVIFQKAEKQLIILNDHLSSKPMYYMEQRSSFLFGSEKKSILAVAQNSPSIDPVGLLQIFTHQHNVGGRTFIEGLKRLPPASWLDYHQGKLSLRCYSLMTFKVPESISSTGSLIEEWGDRLKQATCRRLEGKDRILISLSAGLDSRAVVSAIPREFRPMAARTWGAQNSLEVIYATEIAKQLGFNHFREDPMRVPLSEILPKVVWRTEGAVAFTHCLTMANHAIIKEHGDFMVGGWLGDVSSGGHISPFMLVPRSWRQFVDMIYQRYPLYARSSLVELFNKEFLDNHFPDLKDAFIASFNGLAGETNIQQYEIWDLCQRQANMTLSTAAVDSYLFGHIRPFADRNYLDFIMTLPSRLRFGQVLYQAMIHQLGPEIQHIPNANNNQKLKATVLGNLLNKGIDLGVKVSAKTFNKIKPSFRSEAEKISPDDITLNTRQDPGLRRIIEEFVHSPFFDSSIFNKTGILNTLDKHYQGVTDYADLLCTLATFAVGLPYFVYHKPTHCPPEAEPLS